VNVHLEDAPQYEAISYVWGDPDMSHTINLMNGRTIAITASVARALPYLVNACQTEYLWIDQITIDQRNIEERSQQVKIMGEIYSRSFRCLIWIDSDPSLGVETEIELAWSNGAGEDLRKFLQSFSGNEIQHVVQSLTGEEEGQLLLSFETTSSRPMRDHLLWFLEHPWFSRTWVIQPSPSHRSHTLPFSIGLPGVCARKTCSIPHW
jgi:hypothetical protein